MVLLRWCLLALLALVAQAADGYQENSQGESISARRRDLLCEDDTNQLQMETSFVIEQDACNTTWTGGICAMDARRKVNYGDYIQECRNIGEAFKIITYNVVCAGGKVEFRNVPKCVANLSCTTAADMRFMLSTSASGMSPDAKDDCFVSEVRSDDGTVMMKKPVSAAISSQANTVFLTGGTIIALFLSL